MTQRRNDPDRLSNYFDSILDGIGHRGSSFTDVDALTHDEQTDRFLFQEFKGSSESIPVGQWRLLKGLARHEYITVWCVQRRDDGLLTWYDVGSRNRQTISIDEYQARFRRWWAREAVVSEQPVESVEPPADIQQVLVTDIRWG